MASFFTMNFLTELLLSTVRMATPILLVEIYDVYVAGDRLSGVLYVDGHMDGPVML